MGRSSGDPRRRFYRANSVCRRGSEVAGDLKFANNSVRRILVQKFGLEPFERFRHPWDKGLFIVAAAGDDFQLVLDACLGQCLIHGLGLL